MKKRVDEYPIAITVYGKRAKEFATRKGESREDLSHRILDKLQVALNVFDFLPGVGDEIEVKHGESYTVKERYFHLVDGDARMELKVKMSHDATAPVLGEDGSAE